MSQQMQKYADWLVANQNKKGTPEFDTVANAYKQLRGQQQQQPAAPQPQQPQGTDGPFAFGVDQLQMLMGKGIEAAGRRTGNEGIESFGSQVVANQQRDIAEGGYQPKYPKTLREYYQEGEGNLLPAFGEKLLETLPSGGMAIAGLVPALFSAPAWLTFTTAATATGGSFLMGTGESALEQEQKLGGNYDENVALGTGALIAFLDRFGAGKVIPTNKLSNMTAEEVIQELSQKGFGDAAQAYASRVTKAAVGEGATEMGQDAAVVATTAAQGGQYTPQEIIDRQIEAGALGTGIGGGTSAVTNLAPTAASTREAGAQKLTEAGEVLNPVMVGNDPQAATELAVRLDRIAQANDLNLRDVGKTSTKGAREAVDKAHIQMTEELKQLARDLKAQLGITDQDELSVVMDKIMAIAAQREARNKAKSTVGVEEMQAVERLVGNTQEGQRMLSLMRQMNELTTLHNEGYIGGLSQYTDQLSPVPSNVGYSDRSLIETPTRVLGTLYGASVNPLIPAVQGAAVLTGRTLDALTGRRSRVAKYISDNVEASEGIDTSGSPSVRRARQREAEALKTAASADARRAKEIHKELYAQNGDLPFLTLDTMLKEMGLSPQQAVKLLEEMKASMPTVRADADDMIRSIKEGGRVTNITAIGAAMRTALDQNQTSVTRDKTPIAPQSQAANPSPAESAGYLRGIEDNRAANDALVEAVNGNPNIAPLDKLVLIEALADLRSNLGANPAERAMDIAGAAEAKMQQPELADTYLMPYINRVVGQQANDADVVENFMAVRIVPKDQPILNMQQQPVLSEASDPFGIGDDIGMTSVGMMPTDAELAEMKEGTFVPEEKTKLEVAYGRVFEKWKQIAGQDTPLEYTPENVERIARMMATEGLQALQKDNSAIGWYDATLRAAKDVLRIIEPRIDANEQAFDFALAVTSNGQAVTENFKYALDAFRTYLDTGKMPENFKQGGERNKAMRNSFKFFNAWQRSGQNMSLEQFMNTDYTVAELRDFIKAFNAANGTNINIGSQESPDTIVKGSYVLGPKIGQGFYQNLRGNFEPLTMDIWWMRMWNRLVGRPFEAPSTEKNILKRRNIIKRGIIDNKDKDMKRLVNEALEATGETRRGLYTDPDRFDKVIAELAAGYQRFYNRYKKRTGKNHVKPKWIAAVGTHKDKMFDKLQASPLDGPERSYMREVTQRARGLLSEQGYDINTADFQALMWYPEKQLAEKMGIAKGKGEDNDYLDAAKLAATREGITDEQIQEALTNAERDRLDSRAVPRRGDGRPDSGASEFNSSIPITNFELAPTSGRRAPSRPVTPEETRDQLEIAEAILGKGGQLELGKEGGPFENGVQDVRVAALIADAIGVGMQFYDTQSRLYKDIHERFRTRSKTPPKGKVTGGLQLESPSGNPLVDRTTGQQYKSFIAVQKPFQSKKIPEKNITLGEHIFSTFHELGHAIEGRSASDNFNSGSVETFTGYPNQGRVLPVQGTRSETMRDYMTQIRYVAAGINDKNPVSKIRYEGTQEEAQAIVADLDRMQMKGVLTIQGERTPVRPEYEKYEGLFETLDQRIEGAKQRGNQKEVDFYVRQLAKHKENQQETILGYHQTPAEQNADPIAYFFVDPKGFKRDYPAAYRMIKDYLNSANSPTSDIVKDRKSVV